MFDKIVPYFLAIAAVKVEGELTDWFDVKTGLRQDCVLSPALFNVFLDRVIKNAFAGMNHGVCLPDGRKHKGDDVEGVLSVSYAIWVSL